MAEPCRKRITKPQHVEPILHRNLLVIRHQTKPSNKHPLPGKCCANCLSPVRIILFQLLSENYFCAAFVVLSLGITDCHDPDMLICFNVTPSESTCS